MTAPRSATEPLVVENRHTGERMEMVRRPSDQGEWLEIRAFLPAHTAGPPLHLHRREIVEIRVTRGAVSFIKEGRRGTLAPGESIRFPRGSDHRWWNESDDAAEFEMTVAPVEDFDRYLQGLYQIANAGPSAKPPLIPMAHLTLRHAHTQEVLVLPGLVHGPFWWSLKALGTLLGRYRGDDWPGAPARCPGAPVVQADADA